MLEQKEPKYLKLYNYYKNLILSGILKDGEKMPSVRKCSVNFELSRTTVETAYEMLAAEGYIISKPQSGYYVCKVDKGHIETLKKINTHETDERKTVRFDLSTTAGDKASFNFSLWRRYVKSALRQDERLLSYGEPQGEADLREAICTYAQKERGVVCTPSQIVVAAGTQSLLGILCSITKEKKDVLFVGSKFEQAKAVFEDYGKNINAEIQISDKASEFESYSPSLIYTSPSHINSFGSVLKASKRKELLGFANRTNCLIIEDDYDSEFRYDKKPMPSLQGMNGGHNVIYIGTFSKLLLPSIRISFMVLPMSLIQAYLKRKDLYNQTASKAEQIALCQYIRDGHLAAQIRKQRKLYAAKSIYICKRANEVLKSNIVFKECMASYLIEIQIKTSKTANELCDNALQKGLKLKPIGEKNGLASVLISIAGFNQDDTDELLAIIAELS